LEQQTFHSDGRAGSRRGDCKEDHAQVVISRRVMWPPASRCFITITSSRASTQPTMGCPRSCCCFHRCHARRVRYYQTQDGRVQRSFLLAARKALASSAEYRGTTNKSALNEASDDGQMPSWMRCPTSVIGGRVGMPYRPRCCGWGHLPGQLSGHQDKRRAPGPQRSTQRAQFTALVGFNNPAILKTGRFPSRYWSPDTPAHSSLTPCFTVLAHRRPVRRICLPRRHAWTASPSIPTLRRHRQ
jgi:hypothetical protein